MGMGGGGQSPPRASPRPTDRLSVGEHPQISLC